MRLRLVFLILFSLISVALLALIVSIASTYIKYYSIEIFGNQLYVYKEIAIITLSSLLVAIIEDIIRIYIVHIGFDRLKFSIYETCFAVGATIAAFEIINRFPSDANFFIIEGEGNIYSIIGIVLLVILSILKIIMHILICKIEYISFLKKKNYTFSLIILCHGIVNSVLYFTQYIINMIIIYKSKLYAGIEALLSYILLYSIFLLLIKYIENSLSSYEQVSTKNW